MAESTTRQHVHGHSSHGNTVAAWTTVAILIGASLVAALSFPFQAPWLFAVAIVIAVVGLVIGKLMSMAGLGAVPSYTEQAPEETTLEGPTGSDGEVFPQ